MKLLNIISLGYDYLRCLKMTFRPTLSAVIESPSYLLNPKRLSDLSFYHVWLIRGEEHNEMSRETKVALITPYAHGVVLDVGAGVGHAAHFFCREKVTKYVALEPNAHMHPHIRKNANEAGYNEEDGSLVILSCDAEDVGLLSYSLGGDHKVDTIVSIFTLCALPQCEKCIERLVDRILKPGGEFLFREHVAHPRSDVRFWQSVWDPIWSVLIGGCKLTCLTDIYIQRLPFWQPFPGVDANGGRIGIWAEESDSLTGEDLVFVKVGRFLKIF